MMPNFSPKNVGLEVLRPAIFMINRTQLKPKNQVLYVKKTVWTSPFLLEGWISYQIKKKKWGKGGLTWTQFLDGCCWEDRGEIFQDGGGARSFYIKIN